MSVENSIKSNVIVARDGIVGNVGIFHVLPPPLHLAGSILEELVLFPVKFFGGDRFI